MKRVLAAMVVLTLILTPTRADARGHVWSSLSPPARRACIRRYESPGAGYRAVSRTGKYRGAYQFDQRTWDATVRRMDEPQWAGVRANHAPPDVQDRAADLLYTQRGLDPWPTPRKHCR